jgi:predicted ATPase
VGREPKDIERSSEFLRRFFQEGVRYLGPLRDSPRPVYQPEALESETDVGYRGEHTAAVLDINRRRQVFYRRPPVENLEDDYANVAAQHNAQLHEAVVEWLVYLGVADDVVTTDAGVYGNRLQVSTDNQGHLHDLTNVGVGVSQVLPIVVMALLAPKGSLLIFEQPELHLHPKVQARLADLFLALALDGKQMILETHSEYLIDRFRLRVALSDTDSVRPLVNILFSEKANGQTDLTSIDLNEYGGVLKWPKDFFEQSQKDVSRILRATAKRRKNKSKNS